MKMRMRSDIFKNKFVAILILSLLMKAYSWCGGETMFSRINNRSINLLSSAIYLLMSAKRVPQGTLLERDRGTAGCSFRITIKHDLLS